MKYKNLGIPSNFSPDTFERIAREALDAAQADPNAAIRKAGTVIDALPPAPLEAQSIARRAIALARVEQGEPIAARIEIAAAIDMARTAGARVLVAQALITASLVQLACGDGASARACADEAVDLAEGAERFRAEAQRALILQRLGDSDNALRAYDLVIPELARTADRLWLCRALSNRGVLRMYRNELDRAESDLHQARDLALATGQDVAAARCEQNLGCIATRRGDIHVALATFDRAQRLCEQSGATTAMIDADRCEALLLGGLFTDAVEAASRSVAALHEGNSMAELAEAELQLSRAYAAAGRPDDAGRLAQSAERHFEQQGRASWALVARGVGLEASGVRGDWSTQTIDDALVLAGDLFRSGWRELALGIQLACAASAEHLDDLARARSIYNNARRVPRLASIDHRILAAGAAVHLHRLNGAPAAGRAAFTRGTTLLRLQRDTMGSDELRAALAHRHRHLIDSGLQLERALHNPRRAIACADAMVDDRVLLGRTRTIGDDGRTDLLMELRALRSELHSASSLDPFRALRRAAFLESTLLARARADFSTEQQHPTSRATGYRAGSGVCLVHVSGEANDIVLRVAIGRATTQFVLSGDEVLADVDDLAHTVTEINATASDHPRRDRLELAFEHARHAVSARIWSPIASATGNRALLIVPGPLAALPWGLVPGIAETSFSLVDSLRRPRPPTIDELAHPALLVAGPGLALADAEVAAIATIRPASSVRHGADATVDGVLDGLSHAATAHLAAHGSFRLDNPLFSSLYLHDGPLHAYELSDLSSAPSTVVLASCSAGLQDGSIGGASGFASALLRVGATCVIAPLLDVEDAASHDVMIALHELLVGGMAGADALRQLRSRTESGSPFHRAAASFAAFGAFDGRAPRR